ncbi:hypothetical protein F183_A05890 [Bryobacterales bacterium F-183]|nr:hypothetical protein F183_A05890 [Bryobacterales bacterium F-183]
MTRREMFLLASAVGVAGAKEASVSFGIIADVHHGLMPDAHDRLRAFLEAASGRKLDFLVQLGDFCHPGTESREFLRDWHGARTAKYSVLGNHDMDKGSKREILDALRQERSYYSFDAGGVHFVVLDCNYIRIDRGFVDFDRGNYFQAPTARDWVSAEQMEWLEADLNASKLPGVVFAHQPVYSHWGLPAPEPRRAVREVFARVKAKRRDAVMVCFGGHQHVDDSMRFEDVEYIHINSASYFWVGEEYGRLAKYRDPLFGFVTIADGRMTIEGRQSVLLPPTPSERKHPDAARITAALSSRKLSLKASKETR